MKTFKVVVFFLFCSYGLQAQGTFLRNSYAVRDIVVKQDSVFLIEKRDVKYFNYTIKDSPVQSYFIGGYGLEIYNDVENNELITVSSEFDRPVTSLRFYHKPLKKVVEVYYYIKGRSIDALIIPELKHVAISLSDNKIIIVNYAKKPSFKVEHEIQLKAMSRRLIYQNGNLYYGTDLGKIFKYNLDTKENLLIHSCGKRITDFTVFNNFIVYSTDEGEITKINMLNKTTASLRISDNFVLSSLQFDNNKLICGTFKGLILVIDIGTMTLIDQLNYHKRSVLKIINSKKNEFYSSSIDKTIKKWSLDY